MRQLVMVVGMLAACGVDSTPTAGDDTMVDNGSATSGAGPTCPNGLVESDQSICVWGEILDSPNVDYACNNLPPVDDEGGHDAWCHVACDPEALKPYVVDSQPTLLGLCESVGDRPVLFLAVARP